MIGLGTYAFFWQHSDRATARLDAEGMLEQSIRLGAEVFQFCDYAEIEAFDDARLDALSATAAAAGMSLELGTKGVHPEVLDRYLVIARRLGARVVRTMLYTPDHRPTIDEAAELLSDALPRYAAAGVTIALETYEQVPTEQLAGLVERLSHPNLGICLDPANGVAALENPSWIIDRVADLTVDLHVKDFAFTRAPGWVGFSLAGARFGEGMLDLDHLYARVQPRERGIAEIVEHWLPWRGSEQATVEEERSWTSATLEGIRAF